MTESSVYWAWLTIGLYPHSHRKWWILRDRISPETIYDMVMDGENPGLTRNEFQKLKSITLTQAEYLLESCLNRGINVYCPDDRAYPRRLLEIDNPPALLFSYGKLESVRISPSLAVIGSRNADDYALHCADVISYQLAQKGITVVSGFAKGIDSAAHNASLRAGGQTVAVLGCGLEYNYPANSMKFKERIAENGAVISEYFPNSRPAPENFKIRNRIVSGLSDGIVIISAGSHSGSLNTASHGMNQGKDIFVVPPHDIFSGDYEGNIGLLRDGATPIYSIKDIFNNMTTDNL